MQPIFMPAFKAVQAMAESVIGSLPQVLVGLVLFWLSLVLAKRVRKWAKVVATQTKGGEEAGQVLGQLAYGAVVVAGAGAAAAVMGVGLRSVLAGIGVSGVVVGFAFKDILENYFAGILLMMQRPFHIGDAIKTGEYEGKVQVISTRSTVIETWDGQLVLVPNARIYSAALINQTALANRRTAMPLRVPYETNLEDLRSKLLAIVQELPAVLNEPAPDVIATGFDDKAVALELRYWTLVSDVLSTRTAVVTAVKTKVYGDRPPPPAPEPSPK